MINNRIIISLVLFLFISACGYKPIFSSKENNFYISEIIMSGDRELDLVINNNLKSYKNDSDKLNKYQITIESTLNKIVSSRDSKGDPSTFTLEINTKLNIIKNENIKNETNFKESFNYVNSTKKFELKRYEEQIKKNLLYNISNNISSYLQSI